MYLELAVEAAALCELQQEVDLVLVGFYAVVKFYYVWVFDLLHYLDLHHDSCLSEFVFQKVLMDLFQCITLPFHTHFVYVRESSRTQELLLHKLAANHWFLLVKQILKNQGY